ncbi:MAG: glycoside hydrolase family 2 TIM barrel-domain containing protein [Ferruginibacter sp.]
MHFLKQPVAPSFAMIVVIGKLLKKAIFLLFIYLLYFQAIQAQPGFVKVKGHQFVLNNHAYYYIGANYWYGGLLGLIKDPKKGKGRLQKELDFLSSRGVNNLRVMAGVEGSGLINGVKRVSPALQTSQGNFDENILTGLDLLLYEMGKRNMKAVIYLSNNWEWTGGFLQYLNWNGLLSDSILRKKMNWDENRDYVKQFYSCKPCITAFNKQVKTIITRRNTITGKLYVNDPSIMAWEMANEPRPMRPEAITAFTQWINETADFIKSLDANHLVTTGSEGEMGNENIQTFEAIHSSKNVDYLTIHIWPKNWGWFSDTSIAKGFNTILSNTKAYITKHASVANRLNKPLVIEEFGLPRNNHSFLPAASTTLRNNYYRQIFQIFNASVQNKREIAGCNFWGFSGSGRAAENQDFWWTEGDDYMADPPPEEQGLNSVFDNDTSTWKLISSFTKNIKK